MFEVTAAQIAAIVGGLVEGDPNCAIRKAVKLEEAGPGSLSFLGNSKYEPFVYTSGASILLVDNDFKPKQPITATLIRVSNVYGAMATLLEAFSEHDRQTAGISPLAFIDNQAELADQVAVGPFAVIEARAQIGKGSTIGAQVFVGKNVRIGRDVTIYPGAKIYHNCIIGDRCVIHANVVIGADGFGFAPQEDGSYKKIPQIGNVVLEDDVEVGACTTIDRAALGSTIIRAGVKLDNLIQVAHNVEIGRHTAIAAHVGIAGSAKVGAYSQIGGQTGISGHITLPDGVKSAAQTGIMTPPKAGATLAGSPAMGLKDYLKSYAIFRKLPELLKRLETLEKLMKQDR